MKGFLKTQRASKQGVPQGRTKILSNDCDWLYIAAFLLFLLIILLKTAWICDDASISFRTVDNFLNGYGLRWNVSERVQTYTNPLMVFCMIVLSFFTREYYLTAMLFNIGTTLAAVLIFMFGIAKGKIKRFILPVVFLLLSKAFIDYATSGLENSLGYLILSVFYFYYLKWERFSRRQLFLLAVIASLSLLNRMDSILLLLPALLDAFLLKGEEKWWKNILPGVLGLLPFIVWELFSLLYYGFLFPNTAYAKLNAGIPVLEYIWQGIVYYLDALNRDPITLFAILLAICFSIYSFVFARDRKMLSNGIGVLLYCSYIFRVGGDFMSGRFFAIVLFSAVIILSKMELGKQQILLFAVCAVFYTALLPDNNLTSGADYSNTQIPGTGITDERGHYYPKTGLLCAVRQNEQLLFNRHSNIQVAKEQLVAGEKTVVFGSVGFYGLTAGPEIHVIDYLALGDALLARLPARYNPSWRIGHLARAIPDGYIDTVDTGENQLSDARLAEYYDVLHNIISGDLFSKERLVQIIKMNLGMYNYLIDIDRYRQKALPEMVWADLSQPIKAGAVWTDENAWILDEAGTNILLGEVMHSQEVSILADNNDKYQIILKNGGQVLYQEITDKAENGGMQPRSIAVPEGIAAQGFDAVEIVPLGGDGKYSIGYLQCG